METTLAVLMALGIFLVGPALIGFGILGVAILSGKRALRAQRARALEEADRVLAEARAEEEKPAKVA